MTDEQYHGPAWDLTSEYESVEAPGLEADLEEAGGILDRVEALNEDLAASKSNAGSRSLALECAREIYELRQEASVLLDNISTYARCLLSVDSKDEAAQALLGRLKNVAKRAQQLGEPLRQFLLRADEPVITQFLEDPRTEAAAFEISQLRKLAPQTLPLAEENLITALGQDGVHAWGSLYGQLSGTLRCEVMRGNQPEAMGLAEAAALMSSRSLAERKAAWQGINDAWEVHEETCAASLNAIAGWRLELGRKRQPAGAEAIHFLDAPTHSSRISRRTLDTLMAVAEESRPLARRAARLQARAYGMKTIGPWDVRAPGPLLESQSGAAHIPFEEAVEMVADAYSAIEPGMGAFVRMMIDNRWVEGTVGPNKRPGAYCTGFAKSRTPRVYMTYDGAASEIITLAHELGHAYHSWVMRDLPRSQLAYGMSLAETASTIAETLVRDHLVSRSEDPAARLDIMWEELSALTAFLLNIPTRFTFEKAFYEQRADRPLRPAEFKALMSNAWEEWYGDSLAEPDPMFWASKLHFFISGLSFYNFPYLFGYLFSNGIFARRAALGETFPERFNALLRDTGRMTAEELAREHLDVDLEGPEFWRESVALIAPKVDAFEATLDELGLQVSEL